MTKYYIVESVELDKLKKRAHETIGYNNEAYRKEIVTDLMSLQAQSADDLIEAAKASAEEIDYRCRHCRFYPDKCKNNKDCISAWMKISKDVEKALSEIMGKGVPE